MRRQDREITDREQIDKIIDKCKVVRIGLSDNGQAYIVPMCFGYDGEAFYLHCAKTGRKLDIIRKNNRICFELDIPLEIVEAEQACGWGMKYQCVMGEGTAVVVDDIEEKVKGLKLIMSQYTQGNFTFPQSSIDNIAVIKICIRNISGKQKI